MTSKKKTITREREKKHNTKFKTKLLCEKDLKIDCNIWIRGDQKDLLKEREKDENPFRIHNTQSLFFLCLLMVGL